LHGSTQANIQKPVYPGMSFLVMEALISSLNFGSGTTQVLCFLKASSNASLNRLRDPSAFASAIESLGSDVLTHLDLVICHPIVSQHDPQVRCTDLDQDVPEAVGEEEIRQSRVAVEPRFGVNFAEQDEYQPREPRRHRRTIFPGIFFVVAAAAAAKRGLLVLENGGERVAVVCEENDEVHDVPRERMDSATRNRRFRGLFCNRRLEFDHHRIHGFAEFFQRFSRLRSDGSGCIVAEDLLDFGNQVQDGLVNVKRREDFLCGFSAFGHGYREDEERNLHECRLGDGDGGGENVVAEDSFSVEQSDCYSGNPQPTFDLLFQNLPFRFLHLRGRGNHATRYHPQIHNSFSISSSLATQFRRRFRIKLSFRASTCSRRCDGVGRSRRPAGDGFRIQESPIRFQNPIKLLLQMLHSCPHQFLRSSKLSGARIHQDHTLNRRLPSPRLSAAKSEEMLQEEEEESWGCGETHWRMKASAASTLSPIRDSEKPSCCGRSLEDFDKVEGFKSTIVSFVKTMGSFGVWDYYLENSLETICELVRLLLVPGATCKSLDNGVSSRVHILPCTTHDPKMRFRCSRSMYTEETDAIFITTTLKHSRESHSLAGSIHRACHRRTRWELTTISHGETIQEVVSVVLKNPDEKWNVVVVEDSVVVTVRWNAVTDREVCAIGLGEWKLATESCVCNDPRAEPPIADPAPAPRPVAVAPEPTVGKGPEPAAGKGPELASGKGPEPVVGRGPGPGIVASGKGLEPVVGRGPEPVIVVKEPEPPEAIPVPEVIPVAGPELAVGKVPEPAVGKRPGLVVGKGTNPVSSSSTRSRADET
ncbi:unnamed protein product, partial [Thlaspi arvense]